MDIEILNIAANTKNNKKIKNFTHKSKNKNPLCGDEVEISLIVKNQKISNNIPNIPKILKIPKIP